MKSILQATEVVKEFGPRGHRHRALDGVSLLVDEGDRIGIVGESGSGKSTLSRMLCGLDKPTAGHVELNGREVAGMVVMRGGRRELRTQVQYVAQDTTSSFDPRRTLLDAVTAPLRSLFDMGRDEATRRALELIESLELAPALAYRRPTQVSGGQRQRFALARGLVVRPRILICDEVVSALDVSVQGTILNILKEYCEDTGAALVFVSHGLPATAFVTEHLVVMHRGKVVETGAARDVLRQPTDPYTAELVAAHRGRAA
ncbi:MAG: dipeptide/oligopeptide/nickel ABC transporter ATP-binding protein [Nocardioidaceae bacterium]